MEKTPGNEIRVFVVDHNQIFCDIKNHFKVVDNIDEADWLFIWNDVLPIERSMINLFHHRGKKVAVFQHGRYGTSRYYPPFNEKIQADVLFVWGEADRQALIEAGQDPNKIVVAGTTIFSHLKEKKKHKGKIVVFSPDHWDKEIPENLNTRDELNKLKGVKIITKIIDGQNPQTYKNPIQSNRTDSKHLDICADTLAAADLLVSVNEGTFELLAQALDIPVIVLSNWTPKTFGGDPRYLQGHRRPISNASTPTTLDKLNENCYNELRNPDRLSAQRKEIIVSQGGYGLDTVSIIKQRIEH